MKSCTLTSVCVYLTEEMVESNFRGIAMQFAEMIKEARLQAQLSQQRLAEQLVTARRPKGVWATYIGQIEKGEKVPSDEVCIKLAEVLELDSNTVLIAAYEAKASSEEGRALYGKMMRSLSDPVVNKLLSSEEPLDPALLGVLSNPEIVTLLGDQPWLEAVTRARKKQKERDVLGLLALVEAMDDQQWTMIRGIIDTWDLKPPS